MYDWDEGNLPKIAAQGVTQAEAEEAFEDDALFVGVDDSEGEERVTTVGRARSGRYVVVVTAARGDKIRIVTAYQAPAKWVRRIQGGW